MFRPSEKQREVLDFAVGPERLLVAIGATRSGKSTACAYSHALWMVENGGGYHHAIAGRTVRTALQNFGKPFMVACEELGMSCRYQAGMQLIEVETPSGKATVWMYGANDRESRAKVQGATWRSLHVDELPVTNAEFWPLAWSRLSVEGSKAWCTGNPEGPTHWVKRGVVDRVGEYDGKAVKMLMEDNPGLTDEFRGRLGASMTGHWHSRLVLGEWVGASGLIFPEWGKCGEERVPARPVWKVGFDFGAASVTAAVLFGCEEAGGRWPERAVAVSEFRHDARSDVTLSDSELLGRFERWVGGATGVGPGDVHVYVDPSTHHGFQVLLGRAGYRVRDAQNDVGEGIRETASRLAAGNVELLEGGCPELEKELHTYSWDVRAQDRGEDKPVKSGDHGVDALRYYAYTSAGRSGLEEWTQLMGLA